MVGWIATVSSKSRLVAPMRNCHPETLQQLVRAGPEHIDTGDYSLGPDRDQFSSARGLRAVSA